MSRGQTPTSPQPCRTRLLLREQSHEKGHLLGKNDSRGWPCKQHLENRKAETQDTQGHAPAGLGFAFRGLRWETAEDGETPTAGRKGGFAIWSEKGALSDKCLLSTPALKRKAASVLRSPALTLKVMCQFAAGARSRRPYQRGTGINKAVTVNPEAVAELIFPSLIIS